MMDDLVSKKLDEIIKNRKRLVKDLKVNKTPITELTINNLKSDSTHFITELLQNAEDEGAEKVIFELSETELIFSHDAPNPFNIDDIESITNFGKNDQKRAKKNAIGRFGTGFKSVYSITDSPRIVSGDFDITIKKYWIPVITPGKSKDFYNGTKIILGLKENGRKDIFAELEKKLKELDMCYILFLTNIEKIEWSIRGEKGNYRKIPRKNGYCTLKSDSGKQEEYLVFTKAIKEIKEKELVVKIAFKLDNDKSKIVPVDESPLFVFFPLTKQPTYTKFLLHAPFKTNQAREFLDDSYNPDDPDDFRGGNELLKSKLAELLSECVQKVKELGFLNIGFLEVLPINNDFCVNKIYKLLYEAITKRFLDESNEFIPAVEKEDDGSIKNVYSSVKDAFLLGEGSSLNSLLTGKRAKELFGRSKWIETPKNQLLHTYLKNLGIDEKGLTELANALTENFLLEMTDDWYKTFYKNIHEKTNELWRKPWNKPGVIPLLWRKPIIRIEENGKISQTIPYKDYDEKKPNACLPKKDRDSKFPTVVRSIADDPDAYAFLSALGLREPDDFDEVEEYILKMMENCKKYETEEEYFNDFKVIIDAYRSPDRGQRGELIEKLRKIPFIRGKNKAGKIDYLRPENIYNPSDDRIMSYFKGNRKIYFVVIPNYDDERLIVFKDFLKKLRVLSNIPQMRYNIMSDMEKRNLFPDYMHDPKIFEKWIDYDLDGLKIMLSSCRDLERSLLLWSILQDIRAEGYWYNEGSAAYGEYQGVKKRTFPSTFFNQLRSKWIFKDGNLFSPDEITYGELPREYKENEEKSRELAKLLGFKPEDVKEILKTENENLKTELSSLKSKLKSMEIELLSLKKEKEEKAADDERKKMLDELMKGGEGIPKPTASGAEPIVKPFIGLGTGKPVDYSSGYGDKTGRGAADKSHDPAGKPTASGVDTELIKTIEERGENAVRDILLKEFPVDSGFEIICNVLKGIKKNIKGADFVVKKDGEEIRYVEVKSTQETGKPLYITGYQWETARFYDKKEEGDKYWIYCVFNALEEQPVIVLIQNPFQKWKDGVLKAHPVEFIISKENYAHA